MKLIRLSGTVEILNDHQPRPESKSLFLRAPTACIHSVRVETIVRIVSPLIDQ